MYIALNYLHYINITFLIKGDKQIYFYPIISSFYLNNKIKF